MSYPHQSEQLVRIAEAVWTVGQTLEGDPFAVDDKHLPGVAWPLRARGGSLRAQLANQFREEHGNPPGSGALADAMAVLEGQAFTTPRSDVRLRVARPNSSQVVVDLARPGSSECVVIGPGRWEVADRPPEGVLFRRTRLTGDLPLPVAPGAGDLSRLHELINIPAADRPLVDGFLVAALLADIPHPILALQSRQGAAKTTTARMLVQVIDPSPAPLRAPASDLEQWVTAAAGSWVVALDNVSGLPFWMQDALCRSTNGEALICRALYTDNDLNIVTFRRAVILTGIDLGALRGDLADRTLLLHPEPIPPDRRRTETDLNEAYETARPVITAGIYDLAAQVLDVLADIDLPDPPRMADFAHVLAAIDKVTGTDGLGHYTAHGDRLATDVLESDEVATAILRLMDTHNEWEGTATELLEKIRPDTPTKTWPLDSARLGGRITRATPGLEAAGLRIDKRRTTKGANYTIRHDSSDGNDGENPSLFSPSREEM